MKMPIPKFSVIVDKFKAHRLQIAVWFLVAGIVLTGVNLPLPQTVFGIKLAFVGLPATIAAPILFPHLIGLGRFFLLIGMIGGGFAMVTKFFKLAPDDSAKLAAALAEATRTGKPQRVETRADRPDVTVTPIEPTPRA